MKNFDEAGQTGTPGIVLSGDQLGPLTRRKERELAHVAWTDAEAALQKANAFNAADLYAATLVARRRAMAAGIDVMAKLRG